MNAFTDDGTDIVDFGWARAMRDRERNVLHVQCWGCGAIREVPADQAVAEMHFDHATGNCSMRLALRNRKRGHMPRVH